MYLQLAKWGKVPAQTPNLATCYEFTVSWTSAAEDLALLVLALYAFEYSFLYSLLCSGHLALLSCTNAGQPGSLHAEGALRGIFNIA